MALNHEHFVKPTDPILIKIAAPIPVDQIASLKTNKIVDQILNIAYGEQTDRLKPVLVGVAAPQLGISKRIILVDVGADGHGNVSNLQVFINPEITWQSDETEEWYEGCFSTDRVCGIVDRPKSIRISAYDQAGKPVEGDNSGYVARIFQHEIDHLDGKEFVAHITDYNKLHWVEEDQFPQYRDQEAWRNWPVKCSSEKWNLTKGI